MTIKEVFSIPRMGECIDGLNEAQVFTSLECDSGYWQIPIAEVDRDKTAFISHYGLFRFVQMLFRLTQAPGAFQIAIDIIISSVH